MENAFIRNSCPISCNITCQDLTFTVPSVVGRPGFVCARSTTTRIQRTLYPQILDGLNGQSSRHARVLVVMDNRNVRDFA